MMDAPLMAQSALMEIKGILGIMAQTPQEVNRFPPYIHGHES